MAPLSVLVLKLSLSATLLLLNYAESADPTGYPPYWDKAPGKLADFPTQNNQTAINPWNYTERMGLHKILLKSTDLYFSKLGMDSSGNVLLGLPLNQGWQFQTGRFADPTTKTTCGYSQDLFCTSVQSWWACMTYGVSVLPFFAAADAGLIEGWSDQIKTLPPNANTADFCYSISDCKSSVPTKMEKWKQFFEYLKSVKTSSGKNAQADIDKLQCLMWQAHQTSLDEDLPKFQNRLDLVSGPEKTMDESFVNVYDFIGAACFSTNFSSTNAFLQDLPSRVLKNGDLPPFIQDLTVAQNRILANIELLSVANIGGFLLEGWKVVMCTEKGREAGRNVFQAISSNDNFMDSLKAVAGLVWQGLLNIGCFF